MDWARYQDRWPHRDLSRFVETRAARWHVQRGGEGAKVLLLHGAGASTHSWRGVIDGLLPQVEVLALDLPGHGFTRPRSAARSDLPTMAQDIEALLQAERFRPDLVVGHSAGAALALQMARHAIVPRILGINPALMPFQGVAGVLFPPLARLLALNPFTAPVVARTATEASVRRLIEGTGSTLDAEGMALYQALMSTPSHIDGALQMMARWKLEPLLAALPDINIPTRFAVGEADKTVAPETAIRQARRMPDAQVQSFPGAGHLMHETRGAVFARLILDTLALADA